MKILIENWRKYVISEGNDTNWSSKCLIFDNAGRVLLVEVANKGTLDLPGGHGQDNETPIEAVKREVFEEVGLKIDKIIKIGALSGQRLRYIFAALDFSGTFELQLYTDQIRDIRDKADQIEYYQTYPRYKVGEYEKQKADHTDPNEL